MKRATAKAHDAPKPNRRSGKHSSAGTTDGIRFSAKLLTPSVSAATEPQRSSPARSGATPGKQASWSFLVLPEEASASLPSRSMVSIRGAFNGVPFRATLEPDGRGGHWLKVDRKLRETAGASPGEVVTLEISPVAPADEPEPKVPADLKKALAAAPEKARDVWSDITPIARRDWIHWIVSAKQAETRARRIGNACDMLAKGKRRACCFDRSGMYGKSLSCPIAVEDDD